jgi:hypothetical protein
MKYFAVKLITEEEEQNIFRKKSLLKFIKDNSTNIDYIRHYWWSGDELIECKDYSIDEIISTKMKDISKGHTQLWAAAHHR